MNVNAANHVIMTSYHIDIMMSVTWKVQTALFYEQSFLFDHAFMENHVHIEAWGTYPLLHYPDVYQPCKPVILQQTRVPNSLPMGINYIDYEPQGTEVIQACLQTTPYKRWPQWFSTTPE